MKTFSLKMQASDDPIEALTEIIEALNIVCTDLGEHRAAGGIVVARDHVVNSAGIAVGHWTFDEQTEVEAALASVQASLERAKQRPDGFTEAEWNAAKRVRPGLTKEIFENEAAEIKLRNHLGRNWRGRRTR